MRQRAGLLLQRHPAEQVLDAALDRGFGILVRVLLPVVVQVAPFGRLRRSAAERRQYQPAEQALRPPPLHAARSRRGRPDMPNSSAASASGEATAQTKEIDRPRREGSAKTMSVTRATEVGPRVEPTRLMASM